MHGNSNTNPKGIEIEELPFNLIRRLKNDNLGNILVFSLLRSSRVGRLGVEGSRFVRPCMNPMALDSSWLVRKSTGARPAASKLKYCPSSICELAISLDYCSSAHKVFEVS